MDKEETAPLTVSVEVGGALIAPDLGRGWAYQCAANGSMPVITFGRRKLVSVPRLEALLGRRISAEDVKAARAVVDSRKVPA